MDTTLAKTPLTDWHAAHGARLVDFAGWSMPVQYASIVAEHVATRTLAGLFDISHMGRLRFSGPAAAAFLDRFVTRRISRLAPGQVAYALATNDKGGILDDVLVYRLSNAAGDDYYLMVVNASNREKIIRWIDGREPSPQGVTWSDLTFDWAMIALQGPQAVAIASPLVEQEIAAMNYYTAAETRIAGHGGIVSRTGYTGEDGVELIVGARAVSGLWSQLVDAGATPAGLGCRDTLRLEAGMPLYGHELGEEIDPFQAGLGFAVDLEGGEFPGAGMLKQRKDDKQRPKRVGLKLAGKRVPREGFDIFADAAGQRRIGQVTSGTFSPTFQQPLAMAYVPPEFSTLGAQVYVDVRGRLEPAQVVKLPFYRRSR